MHKKLNRKKLDAWIKEETESAKMYKDHGLVAISKEEKRHAIELKNIRKLL